MFTKVIDNHAFLHPALSLKRDHSRSNSCTNASDSLPHTGAYIVKGVGRGGGETNRGQRERVSSAFMWGGERAKTLLESVLFSSK